ncbi:MAG TPA: hypothetical protein VFS07_02865 [Gemmatimonadales bacterium]|nr:hypothetical protein [Gemmatimonadales bacterium]
MSRRALLPLAWLAAAGLAAAPAAHAQAWRVTLDARAQAVSFRGWRVDSIPATDTVTGSGGGPATPAGDAVTCDPVSGYCRYWRPGADQRGVPTVLTTDATMWGLGVTGLSVHANARLGGDLGGGSPWYGPDRGVELVEGYVDYDRGWLQGRAGRQVVNGRLGWWGVDGGRGWLRDTRRHLEISGYGGWGLARSSNLTVTSSALNVLGDFQTGRRQWAVGGTARWSATPGRAQVEYHREWSAVDGGVTVERAAFGAEMAPVGGVGLSGGAIYDLASGLWGSWDLSARAAVGRRVSATARVRQYRPLFDLWSVWQAFSPVPYHAVDGAIGVRVHRALALRAGGERYWYPNTETETPLVTVEDRGWRATLGATWSPRSDLDVDAEWHREFGVGAYANSEQGVLTWRPRAGWSLALSAGHLERPLDYRYDVAKLWWLGAAVDRTLTERVRFGLTLDRYDETRDRPDAAGGSWAQARVAARLTWLLVSGADRLPLPPGRPRRAP